MVVRASGSLSFVMFDLLLNARYAISVSVYSPKSLKPSSAESSTVCTPVILNVFAVKSTIEILSFYGFVATPSSMYF